MKMMIVMNSGGVFSYEALFWNCGCELIVGVKLTQKEAEMLFGEYMIETLMDEGFSELYARM